MAKRVLAGIHPETPADLGGVRCATVGVESAGGPQNSDDACGTRAMNTGKELNDIGP